MYKNAMCVYVRHIGGYMLYGTPTGKASGVLVRKLVYAHNAVYRCWALSDIV